MRLKMEEYIEDRLIELADEKYKKFHSGLCPNVDNIIGVKVPLLRNLAKELYEEYGLEYFNHTKSDYYEEVMLEGIMIGLLDIRVDKVLEYIKNFLPKINNWAICDTFCSGLKIAKKNKKIFWEFIDSYLDSENEYEVRFAVVMMLYHFLDDEHTIEVTKRIERIKHQGYYVKVAVAWLISIMYIKYPAYTYGYLEEDCNLDDITFNKAIQKINDSKRVSDDDKFYIKDLKRI